MKNTTIIVMTHGNFGKELIKSAELILGKLQNIYSISLMEGEDPLDLIKKLRTLLSNSENYFVILTDIFGGSPSNAASRFALHENVTVLSGVNLPMLIEAEMARMQWETEGVTEKLIQSASEGIKDVKKIMQERQAEKNECN